MQEKIPPEARRIRSFIRRQGRITPGQQEALDHLWSVYCLDSDAKLDFTEVFGRVAPLFMEVGFGNGESLLAMAQAHPENNFIGVEVHKPGVGRLLNRLQQLQINNVRIYCHDAVEVLERAIADSSLSTVLLFFPDPWHKKKHHKRRIVQPEFLDLLAKKLQPGGVFHAATDWGHYAEHILSELKAHSSFENQSPTGTYSERPQYRIVTKFERRGLKLGHGVWDIIFRRTMT